MNDKTAKSPIVRWKWAILGSDLTSTTRLVLLTLAVHMDNRGGSCFPSISTLCRSTGLSKRSVVSSIQKAVAAGWLRVRKKRFEGKSWAQNDYLIAWPESGAPRAPDNHESGAPGAPDREELGAPRAPSLVHQVHTNSTKNSTCMQASTRARELDDAISHDPVDAVQLIQGRWRIEDGVYDHWAAAYANGRTPDETEHWMETELSKASAWLATHSTGRKTLTGFLTDWLSRAHVQHRHPTAPKSNPPRHAYSEERN